MKEVIQSNWDLVVVFGMWAVIAVLAFCMGRRHKAREESLQMQALLKEETD